MFCDLSYLQDKGALEDLEKDRGTIFQRIRQRQGCEEKQALCLYTAGRRRRTWSDKSVSYPKLIAVPNHKCWIIAGCWCWVTITIDCALRWAFVFSRFLLNHRILLLTAQNKFLTISADWCHSMSREVHRKQIANSLRWMYRCVSLIMESLYIFQWSRRLTILAEPSHTFTYLPEKTSHHFYWLVSFNVVGSAAETNREWFAMNESLDLVNYGVVISP